MQQKVTKMESSIQKLGKPRFLSEKKALIEYKRKVVLDYKNNSGLNVLKYKDGMIRGSNPPALILLNFILRDFGLSLASPAEIWESTLKKSSNPNEEFNDFEYYDLALELTDTTEPNAYLATNLYKQIKRRKQNQKFPVIIPLIGLDLINNSKAPDGLVFKLTDDSEIIYAPELQFFNKVWTFSCVNSNGLPVIKKTGKRRIYPPKSGLTRVMYTSTSDFIANESDMYVHTQYNGIIVVDKNLSNPLA